MQDKATTDYGLRQVVQLREHPEARRLPRMDDEAFAAFRADVAQRGILVPLEINSADVLLDGRERLRAARELGLDTVPARLVSAADEIAHMYKAALARKNLSASERAALAIELDEYLEAAAGAARRQRQNLRQNQRPEVATLPPRGERSREIAARYAGISPRIVQHVITVKKNDLALFEQVKQGKIPAHRAARRVRREAIRANALAAPPLPKGVFDLIYADPPWQMDTTESRERTRGPLPDHDP